MIPARRLYSLAVVVPFYNEAAGARLFYERLREQMEALGRPYTLVFVDDGSRDDTLRILNGIAEQDIRVTVLSLARNWGHQTALTAGLDYLDPEAEAVVTMDGDLQHPPETIAAMVAEYERGAEIVQAVRLGHEGVARWKRQTSEWFNRLMGWSAHVDCVPGAADFRLMSRTAVVALQQMREVHRYLRGMVPWLGFTSAVVHYAQAPRHAGTPAYTWQRSLRLAHHGLFSFTTLPLNLITWLGFFFAAAAAAYLAYVAFVAFYGHTVPGWSSVIGVMLVVSAFQFMAMSILAQYLGMVFEESKQRPLYVLKQARCAQGSVRGFRNQGLAMQTDTFPDPSADTAPRGRAEPVRAPAR
jgi:glycosyltransferase involved in cell wall biosynthesis